MEAGTYIFCCYAMPWTARALGVLDVELEVTVELTK